jgi:hypothetical protein
VKSLTVLRADALTQNEVPKKFNIIDLRLKCRIQGQKLKNKISGSNLRSGVEKFPVPQWPNILPLYAPL